MNWRTDKPTTDVIVAKLKYGTYVIGHKDSTIGYYTIDLGGAVPLSEGIIEKWADLEEDETVTDTERIRKEGSREHWLEYFGMPKDNIENCITQIAQGYGACRYLEGVQRGAEAVNELAKETATNCHQLEDAAEGTIDSVSYEGIGDRTLIAVAMTHEELRKLGEFHIDSVVHIRKAN